MDRRDRSRRQLHARRRLVGRERRVARAEVDRAPGDLRDPRTGSDRAVGDRHAGALQVVARPLRDERGDEGAARPDQGLSAAGAPTGAAAAGDQESRGEDERSTSHDSRET